MARGSMTLVLLLSFVLFIQRALKERPLHRQFTTLRSRVLTDGPRELQLKASKHGVEHKKKIAGQDVQSLDKGDVLTQAVGLRSAYMSKYAFPRWVIEQYLQERFADFERDAQDCAIFVDEGTEENVALALATQREPVNIGMCRHYDKARLEQSFGWIHGKYGEIAEGDTARLPPNIAVMCKTPVIAGLRGPDQKAVDAELNDPNNRIYVLNVIGLAFDDERQPDYKYFLNEKNTISDAQILDLKLRFEAIFHKIFAAALHYELKVIVLSKFAAGAFAKRYPGDINEEVWMPAFQASIHVWSKRLQTGGVEEISLMGADNDLAPTVEDEGFTCRTYGYFPQPICDQLGDKLHNTLFVNAWDPWSCIGNGNFADNSLDGFMGRATAMAVLGWPVTNKLLLNKLVIVSPPKSAPS